MGKASSERCTKQERTAPAKPLVAIGELQFDYVSSKNDRSNKKNLFRPLFKSFDCSFSSFLFHLHVFFSFSFFYFSKAHFR